MRNFHFLIFILSFFCLSQILDAQVSLNTLKSAGINSEDDLRKLGISEEQLDKAKSEFFKKQSDLNKPVEIESEIDITQKKEKVKDTSVPKVEFESKKKIEKDSIYGYSIFREGAVNIIKNSDRIKAPDNYVLVSGDKINVTIWGFSEFSGEFILGEGGNITPHLVGRINLKGKSFSKVRKIIKSRFGGVYDLKNSQISVELSYSKVISVNVIGEVMKPGTYSIPSLNSAFNILSLAGGPTNIGSVRSIEIRRNGKLFQELDIYTFMFSPRSFKDQFLQDGDFLVVKTRKGIVELKGEFNRPGKYEFKEGDKYSDILKFCGGLTAMANTSSINITRLFDNQLRMFSIEDVFNGKKDFKIVNGDEIEVLKISNLVRNSVSIIGAVNTPGFYPFLKGERVSDLILKSRGITYEAFASLAHIYRLKKDLTYEIRSFKLGKVLSNPNSSENLLLEEFDKIMIFNKDSFINKKSISVSGMVNNTGDFDYKVGLTLENVILLSSGLKLEADLSHIEVERINFKTSDSGNVEVKILNYPEDLSYELSAFDKIHFRKIPGFLYQQTVTIKGEVKFPGNYSLKGNNERIIDLIKRSGGFTEWAYIESSSINRREGDLGLLLLNLKDVVKKSKSKFNYVLKPGDVITIPKITNIVTIKGAIGYKFINEKKDVINSPFHKRKRASYYIKKYGGGYDQDAKRSKVYVVGYNGLVRHSKFFGLIKPKVKKGDQIIVGYNEKKKEKVKSKNINWNNFIENISIKITGIATLWVLLDKVNL